MPRKAKARLAGAVLVATAMFPFFATGTLPFAAAAGRVTADSCNYPSSSFSESTTLPAGMVVGTPGDPKIAIFYMDEHAMTLGAEPGVTPLPTDPGSASGAPVGVGDTSKTDPSSRPIFPSLFVTDITGVASTSTAYTAGDFQHGGTPLPPNFVSGTWKSATVSGTTITPGPDPAKNNQVLGAGADAYPSGIKNQGYGAEVRWNATGAGGLGLMVGHSYRVQAIVHDGDQNKAGGDAGEACFVVRIPGPPAIHTLVNVPGGISPGVFPPSPPIVPVDSSISDTVSLIGSAGAGNPTGTVDFKLYSPSSSCTGTPVFTDLGHALTNANPSVATSSPDFTVGSVAGTTYVWQDTYIPDTPNYASATETCGDETLSTADARIILTPQSATNIIGAAHTFTATLQVDTGSGWVTLNDSGDTLTFSLPAPANSAFFVNGISSCTTTAGSCSVQVNDNTAETITLHATSTFGASAEGVSGTFTRSTGNTGCSVSDATCDAAKTWVKPGSTLTVSDTMTGLPAGATGSITYKAFTGNTCTGATVLDETDTIVTAGTAPTSTAITIGPGQSVYFEVTYNGSGAGNFGTITSPCTAETATSAAV